MTMPPLPAAGDTNWRDDWAQAVHNAATEVVSGRLTEAAQKAAFVSKRPLALAKLDAGLASREAGPVRLVFAGSSTTAGLNSTDPAHRWVNQLVAWMQAAYPSGTGVEQPVIAAPDGNFGTISTLPGVQGFNVGVSGADSSGYLGSGVLASVAALNPRAVFHMVGANDINLGIAPATTAANITAKIAAIKGAAVGPCVHVLLHSYPRLDVPSPAYPWSAYADAIKGIADADPNNVVFFDLSPWYVPVGIPGSNPLALLSGDSIHQTNAGHAFMASLVATLLGVARGTVTGSTPRTTARITSDTFTGADAADIVGRTSDAGLGGAGKIWVGDANAVALSSGTAVDGSSTAVTFVGIAEPTPDIEASFVLKTRPTAGDVIFEIHRATATGPGSPNGYRFFANGTTGLTLFKRLGGTATQVSPTIQFVAGDRLGLRYYKGVLELRINGAVVFSLADSSLPNAGYAGFTNAGSGVGYVIDDFVIDAIT